MSTMRTLTPDQLALLGRIDSATVANVIELFGLRSFVAGYTNLTIKALYPELPPAVGYAVTATLRSAYPKDPSESTGGLAALMSAVQTAPTPRIIVIQDLDEPPQAATYGELRVASFQRFGSVGLITNGAGRDVEQVRQRRFPCWASSLIVSHGYFRIIDIQVPVFIGGLRILPGDLLHGDGNGVVSIPREISAGVAELCDPYLKAEQIVLDYLQNKQILAEGYKQAIVVFRDALENLKLRARESIGSQPGTATGCEDHQP